MKWKDFERDVADLFELFGYQTTHNTKISGGQTDVLAISPRRNRPDVLAECKYHDTPKGKVGIDDVQRFAARVTTARMNGDVDQGYVVTNTGFTADARACLERTPQQRYVFLVTFEQLLQSLLDAHNYLSDFVSDFARRGSDRDYVPLSVVETTGFPGTAFELLPGDQLTSTSRAEGSSQSHPRAIVLPQAEIDRFSDKQFIRRDANGRTALVFDRLQDEAARIHAAHEARASDSHALYLNALREAARTVLSDVTPDVLARVGFHDQAELSTALAQDLGEVLSRLSLTLRSPMPQTFPPMPLRNRWARDTTRRILDECRKRLDVLQPDRVRLDSLGDFGPVVLSAVQTPHSEEANGGARDSLQVLALDDALRHLNEFLAASAANLYVLLGDYGAGKTTVLNRLMSDLAARKLAAPYDSTIRIPLLINLRDYNKVPDFDQVVRSFIVDQAEMGDVSLRMFRRLSNWGRLILLLDGFDEMLQRVTKPDRRRCFQEIADYVRPKAKIVITGRPGYFPDHAEFAEVLASMETSRATGHTIRPRIACLQLMDDSQVERFVQMLPDDERALARDLVFCQPGLLDLARRPVLAKVITESVAQLSELGSEQVTPRRLYEIYTNKWVEIEEDKGSFRVLISPEQKSTFVRYLAMQMHLSGYLAIHYSELDKRVARYFELDSAEKIDQFSHDVRTCSFLNRTDNGEYRFIHKSFMEFFVACEFERLDESPFAQSFDKRLTQEMRSFLDLAKLPEVYQIRTEKIDSVLERVRVQKDNAIRNADYERAAAIRDVMDVLKQIKKDVKRLFVRMGDAPRLETCLKAIKDCPSKNNWSAETRRDLAECVEEHLAQAIPALGRAVREWNVPHETEETEAESEPAPE